MGRRDEERAQRKQAIKRLKKVLVVCGAIGVFVAMTFAAYQYWLYVTALYK